jgi:hypothetical protein
MADEKINAGKHSLALASAGFRRAVLKSCRE